MVLRAEGNLPGSRQDRTRVATVGEEEVSGRDEDADGRRSALVLAANRFREVPDLVVQPEKARPYPESDVIGNRLKQFASLASLARKFSLPTIASSNFSEQYPDMRAPAWPSKTAKNDQSLSPGRLILAACASSISMRQPCMLLTAYRRPFPVPSSFCFSVFGLSKNAPMTRRNRLL